MIDPKNFLYAWLGKRHYPHPDYQIKQIENNSKDAQFIFESWVRVKGFDYVGHGKGKAKQFARNNASLDFIKFLIRANELKRSDCPNELKILLFYKIEPESSCEPLVESKDESNETVKEQNSQKNEIIIKKDIKNEPTKSNHKNNQIIAQKKIPQKFHDTTIHKDDNELICKDTNNVNRYAPRTNIDRLYNGSYPLYNLTGVRNKIIKFFENEIELKCSLTDPNQYNPFYYNLKKLKLKLNITRKVTSGLEKRMWDEIRNETDHVNNSRKDLLLKITQSFEEYKNR